MSLGQRIRCEIAAGVIHEPSILIFDEATIGLDLSVKTKIYSLLRYLSEEHGTTIIYSSHDVHDIIEMAQRLIVLNDGVISYDGSPTAFLDRYIQSRKISITFREPYESLSIDLSSTGKIEKISDYEISIRVKTKRAVLGLLQHDNILEHLQDFSIAEDDFRAVLERYYDDQ